MSWWENLWNITETTLQLYKCQDAQRELFKKNTDLIKQKAIVMSNLMESDKHLENLNASLKVYEELLGVRDNTIEDLRGKIEKLEEGTDLVRFFDRKRCSFLEDTGDSFSSGFEMRKISTNRVGFGDKHSIPLSAGGIGLKYVLDESLFIEYMTPKTVFDMALKIAQENFQYERDSSLYGVADSCAPPMLFELLKRGDCEDSSSFVLNIVFTYEMVFGVWKDYTPALAHGRLVYSNGSSSGHAFPLLLHNSGDLDKSYVGEPTLRSYRPSESLKQKGNRYHPSWGISTFPHYGCPSGGWQIKKDKRWW